MGTSPRGSDQRPQSMAPGPDQPQTSISNPISSSATETFEPRILDVLVVKAMLSKAFALPVEITNSVLDMAEYWPHSSTVELVRRTMFGSRNEDELLARSRPVGFNVPLRPPQTHNDDPSDDNRQGHFCFPVKTPYSLEAFQKATGSPDPLLEHPCRKIVFTIRSHDQGWGGDHADHGSYRSSWTWFDAGLEKFDADVFGTDGKPEEEVVFDVNRLGSVWPEAVQASATANRPDPRNPSKQNWRYIFQHKLLPDPAHMIQANILAKRDYTIHKVEWRWTDDIEPESPEAEDELSASGRGKATGNGEFVRSLTLGDVVTVWGRARFPAWANHVHSVQIDVYWAV